MRNRFVTWAMPLLLPLAAIACGQRSAIQSTSTPAVFEPTSIRTSVVERSTATPVQTETVGNASAPGPPPVTFVDALHGWSAEVGAVIATSDGGHHWEKRGDLHSRVLGLDFTSIENGWGATQAGLFSTVDGGTTWQSVLSSQAVGRVDFVDQEDGWVSTDSAFLRTRDGGRTWIPETSPCKWGNDPPYPGEFSFVTVEVGFSLCPALVNGPGFASKQLYRTDDGGANWSLISVAVLPQETPSPIGGLPTDLHFLNEDLGWLSEDRGYVFATRDGGRTWQSLPPATEEDQFLSTVVFVSPLIGWTVSRLTDLSWPTQASGHLSEAPGLYMTTDGGATWTPLCVGDFLKCGT